MDAAQANLARVRAGTPERELAVSRTRITTVEAELAQAWLVLGDTELRAPFAGVAEVREGAPVLITVDALPGLSLRGHVTHIRSYGESRLGDITYVVRIVPEAHEPQLRWNMTAAVTIRTG